MRDNANFGPNPVCNWKNINRKNLSDHDWHAIISDKNAVLSDGILLGRIVGLAPYNKNHIIINTEKGRFHIPRVKANSYDDHDVMFGISRNDVTNLQSRNQLGFK